MVIQGSRNIFSILLLALPVSNCMTLNLNLSSLCLHTYKVMMTIIACVY